MSEALSRAVDAAFEREVAFLRTLVRVPCDNPPGDCAPHAEATAGLLNDLGFEVERHRVPEDLCRASGMISATNLIVRRRYGAGPVVALNAHGDVVPPGEGWSLDPYGAEIRDGWLYGRGAAVSKSDFATYAFAILALEAAARPRAGTLELHLTYDEEAGGAIGPKWLLDEGLSRPDYAISAGFSYSVVTAHNGCLHLEVGVRGKSAHAAKPETGHDALEAATAIMTAIYATRAALSETASHIPGIGAPKVNIGLIRGGINTNVVPDRVELRIDRRLIPEEDAERVEAGLRRMIGETVERYPGISAEVARILLARPLMPIGDSERLADIVCRHAEAVLGEPVPKAGVPLYTDARHYAAAGVPTILYGAGPRSIEEANAHRADERVPLAALRDATLVVARSLGDILRE